MYGASWPCLSILFRVVILQFQSLYLGKQLVLQLISSVMNICVGKITQDVNTLANTWPSILHHRVTMTVTIPERHRAKIVASIFGSGMDKKIYELGEDKLVFRRLKATWGAFGMLRISERNSERR